MPSGPYLNGRLTHAAFIELAGDDHQINEIKSYAARQGWTIDCERRVGDQMTLRLKLPRGTRQSAIEGYFAGDLRHPRSAKSNMIYYPMHKSMACILLP